VEKKRNLTQKDGCEISTALVNSSTAVGTSKQGIASKNACKN